MPILTEGNYLGDALKSEAPYLMSRETVTVLAGSGADRELLVGHVLGRRTKSSVTAAAVAGNTGGGSLGTVTLGSKAEVGVYTVECLTAPTAVGTVTPAAYASNTSSSGTIASAVAGANCQVGVYHVQIIRAASNAGTFQVVAPDGTVVGIGTVAVEFSTGDHLTFTVTDATDFVVGDGFTITVAAATSGVGGTWKITMPGGLRLTDDAVTGTAYTSDHLNFTPTDSGTNFAVGDQFTVTITGDDKVVALDPTAVNGSQTAIGILYADTTAPDGTDVDGVAIVRDAIVSSTGLVWPSGATTNQKNLAIAQLKAAGIIVRTGV
ncbi:MAG: head decoration protein [Magnetococcales bacterium]|nr:head decoration protein [Magnetococcales bacterium]